jgi:hypothetical protein
MFWEARSAFVGPSAALEFALAAVVGVIVVPLVEEPLFRGYVLHALAARWHMAAARYAELKAATRVRLVTEFARSGLLVPFARLVQADHGLDVREWMEEDARRIQAVRLPVHLQGLGKKSGEVLHALRCAALAPISQENRSSGRC